MSLSNTKWTLNGATIRSHKISNVDVLYENQKPDELSWMDPLAAFDSDLRWAYDAEIVLAYDGVVRFRGKMRNTPRNLEPTREDINYRALGPWAWLDEMPYVQDYATDGIGGTEARGDVILGQDGGGESITLAAAITAVIGSAIANGCPITLGTLEGLNYAAPFDRTSDQSHAGAIIRLLSAAPSHVVRWDYTGLVPSFNCLPRATMPAVTLPVRPAGLSTGGAYAPFESIKINPLYQLQATAVCLIYRREDVENGVPNRKTFKDYTPAEANPSQPRALTRTWELAGSVLDQRSTYLRQPTETRFIAPGLVTEGSTSIVDAGGTAAQFATLSTFWKRKLPFLREEGVEILGFRYGTRELNEAVAVEGGGTTTEITPACERELTGGAITGWMQSKLNIKAEYQKITVECRYKAFADDTSEGVTKKELRHQIFSAVITATSAQTKEEGYSLLDSIDESFTPAEEPPEGISAQLHAALSELQHDGPLALYDRNFVYDVRPGQVVNLDLAPRPEWLTMRALVQSSRLSIDRARSQISVGFAHQLGFDDLKDMWRGNKNRQPVTSSRKFNESGGAEGVSLTVFTPRNDVTAVDAPPIQGTTEAVTPAGAVATPAELVAKIKKYYTDLGILPVGGHWFNVPVTARGSFRAYVHTSDANLVDQWHTSFQMGDPAAGETYYVTLQQLGIY